MPYSETWAEHYPDGTVIPYMDKKAREAIGEGYNPPYSAGQAIMYEGITYVANTAIASDEIWTPSHWTASNVCAMYNELKSNLTNNTYSTTGLTTHTDATLQYGGYVIIGKMVIVNMRIDITNSIGAYNEIVKGLPYPVSYASNYIAITDSKGLGMYLSTGGSVQNSVSVPSGAIQISGVYLSI